VVIAGDNPLYRSQIKWKICLIVGCPIECANSGLFIPQLCTQYPNFVQLVKGAVTFDA
jgi:hypothetical protein